MSDRPYPWEAVAPTPAEAPADPVKLVEEPVTPDPVTPRKKSWAAPAVRTDLDDL